MTGVRPLVIRTILLMLVLVIADACDPSRVYEDHHEFKKRTWVLSDEPTFAFEVKDSAQFYNLYYNIRNSLDYPYSRIFVSCALYDSAGNELQRKLLQHELFDPAGRPLGESGLGDLYDHQFPILGDYRFTTRGHYSVRFTQFMRQDTLPGVLAIGLRVERREVE